MTGAGLLASLGVVGPAEGASAPDTLSVRLAPAQKGVVVVKIRTPEGVPGVVRLQKAGKVRVVTKKPPGTAVKVRMRVPVGRWSVVPQEVLHESAIYTGTSSTNRVSITAGEVRRVAVTYRQAPSVTQLQVTRIDRFGLDLSWTSPSADAEYAVRMAPGSDAPATVTDGSEVPVDGTTATATNLSPAAQYAFSVFARQPGTQTWWGPVSTSVATPSADTAGGSAVAVTNPSTVMPTGESVDVSVGDGRVQASVPAGVTPTVGQPWVLPSSSTLPGGFVGLVTTVSSDGSYVVLKAGGLADAFDYFDVAVPNLADLPLTTLNEPTASPRTTARAPVEVTCGGSLTDKIVADPDFDPFGSFDATLSKYKVFGKDIPLGMSFDTEFGVDVGVTADIDVRSALECKLKVFPVAWTIPGPVPILVKVEPRAKLRLNGKISMQDFGFTATLGATVEGHLGLGGDDYVDGDLIASASPHVPSITSMEAGLHLLAGVEFTAGPGLGNKKAGAVAGLFATLNPLEATAEPTGGLGCMEVSAYRSASASIIAKAWLGNWETSRTLTVPQLEGAVEYGGSPWNLPSGCGGNDEYRIVEGTLDVTHSWSGGCSNDQGGCDDGPNYTSSNSFSESSDAHLRVAEPGPWVQQWESSRTYLSAPMSFSSWNFDANASWRSSGYGCSWADTWETVGGMQFADAYWETGASVLPGPELSLDGKLSSYYYYDDWSEEWTNNWWGSLGAWDTDYSNGFPKIDTRYTYTSGGECAGEPYTSTYERTMEQLSPGYWWYWPEESRRSSSTSTSTPLEPCTPEACRWRVDGTDTYEFRSDYADYGYQGTGSATVTWSYVIERRAPVPAEPPT